eukprot:TRINITY_DN22713_c0_g1_i1.p1 TRINITY_DN22713_c0_g1~~TRINITY_DN22713_c0_g1_i1.p1  ORF type:complete len:408 (+),score=101.63 TRINITY_DN22713_c0_g1_i1:35-1258(+)
MLLKVAAAVLLVLPSAGSECSVDSKSAKCQAADSDGVYLIQQDTRKKHALGAAKAQAASGAHLGVLTSSEQPLVDDVMQAFNSMSGQGVMINVDKGSGWPSAYSSYLPPYSHHIEGVQRVPPGAGGQTYFYMSGAGDVANLFIAEIPRPDASGPVTGGGATLEGKIVKVLDLGQLAGSSYTHAGGFQISGNVMAIGLEAGCAASARLFGMCQSKSMVAFFDVSDPLNPKSLNVKIDRPTTTAGAVGLLKQTTGKYLAIVGNGDDNDLDLYVQTTDSIEGGFHLAASWSKSQLLMAAGVSGSYKSYQSHNLVSEKDGKIYMIATTRDPLMVGHDYFDLFLVQPSSSGATITLLASRPVTGTGVDFSSGGGIYVDSSTNIFGYATNWLPATGNANPVMPGSTIHINEFT